MSDECYRMDDSKKFSLPHDGAEGQPSTNIQDLSSENKMTKPEFNEPDCASLFSLETDDADSNKTVRDDSNNKHSAEPCESDMETNDTESSDMEESNGFQKIKRQAVSLEPEIRCVTEGVIETPGSETAELPDSEDIEFPDVDEPVVDRNRCLIKEDLSDGNTAVVKDESSERDEPVLQDDQNLEVLMEDIDFPENMEDVDVNESAVTVANESVLLDSESIEFPENEMEIDNLCDTKDKEVLESNSKVNVATTASLASQPSPQSEREENVLRHRIDPEPPRPPCDPSEKSAEDDINPRGSKEKRKIALIHQALESDPVDIAALRSLAVSPGGLINRNIRQQVWPLLVNVNPANLTPKPSQEEMQSLTQTYNQVVMDVNRSSSRFPPGIDDHVRMSMKDKLVDLIMRVMLKHKQLKYYQGFHDVCITFLLCMDEDLAFLIVDKLAMGIMREYLDETMERTSLLLNYIYPLVNKCNPELCEHMQSNDLGTIFALSWVITWFSHVLGDIKRILRVFDFFLASHRMMPVYLSAAFVLYREPDIYEAGDEMGYIHKCLSTIPEDLPLESLLERAGDLYLQYPPTEISCDPMLIRMNRQVYEHFNRVDSRNASRRIAQQAHDVRSRLFVKATMWTVTAVVGVAAAVLYHSYMGQNWTSIDIWSPFS